MPKSSISSGSFLGSTGQAAHDLFVIPKPTFSIHKQWISTVFQNLFHPCHSHSKTKDFDEITLKPLLGMTNRQWLLPLGVIYSLLSASPPYPSTSLPFRKKCSLAYCKVCCAYHPCGWVKWKRQRHTNKCLINQLCTKAQSVKEGRKNAQNAFRYSDLKLQIILLGSFIFYCVPWWKSLEIYVRLVPGAHDIDMDGGIGKRIHGFETLKGQII